MQHLLRNGSFDVADSLMRVRCWQHVAWRASRALEAQACQPWTRWVMAHDRSRKESSRRAWTRLPSLPCSTSLRAYASTKSTLHSRASLSLSLSLSLSRSRCIEVSFALTHSCSRRWVTEHRERLSELGSSFEFRLHKQRVRAEHRLFPVWRSYLATCDSLVRS